MKPFRCRIRAGALVSALVCSATILAVGTVTYSLIQSKYRSIHQTASWKEALLTAEGGIEMAMNEIRMSLYDSENAFSGWARSANPISGPTSTSPANTGTTTYTFQSSAIMREGEGGQKSWAKVSVDAPQCLIDRSSEQWFRIRSLGIAEIPGGAVVAGEKEDTRLRKLELARDRRNGARLATPQAARLIEAIAKPVGAFRLALFGTSNVDMTSQNIVVDSYDSRDNTKSTNGSYDPAKRQSNADIATNGQVINAGAAHIFGDALTNGGSVLNAQNVSGEVSSDFFQEVLTVKRPTTSADVGTPLFIKGNATINAKAGAPSNFEFSGITLTGSDVLRIAGAADGSPTYAQIVVTGNFSTSGQARVILDRGVNVRIFLVGDADITGSGFLNSNSPLALQLYGCDRATNPSGAPTSYGYIKIAGNGGFSGAVYAPNYDIEIKGGGNSDNIYGAFVGHSIRLTGVQSVHYDEALGDGGLISDFKIVSWFEDER